MVPSCMVAYPSALELSTNKLTQSMPPSSSHHRQHSAKSHQGPLAVSGRKVSVSADWKYAKVWSYRTLGPGLGRGERMSESEMNRVEQLFLAAMEIPEEYRREWLVEKCAGDRALFDEVFSLLTHDAPMRDPTKESLGTDGPSPASLSKYAERALQIRCPHCSNPIELVDNCDLSEVTCPTCGSSFSLIGSAQTASFHSSTERTLGRFTLVEKVGIGSFGSVFKAKDTQLDRTVAVKIPRYGQLTAEDAEKFLREARAALDASSKHRKRP